jgi:hypothetical protein
MEVSHHVSLSVDDQIGVEVAGDVKVDVEDEKT